MAGVKFGHAYLDTAYDSFRIPGGADNAGNQLFNAPRTYGAMVSYQLQ